MNTKKGNFQERLKEAYNVFKATFKQEKSKRPEDIIFREKNRENENKIKALNVAVKDKNTEQVDILKTKKTSSNEALLDKDKQRKEKRVKAWSDRGYRTIGPSSSAAAGAIVGTLIGGPIGAAVGTVLGVALGSTVGGRIIQKVALSYGIPAHKAFKKAKEKFRSLKQEQIHKKETVHLNKIDAIQSKDEHGRKQLKIDPNEMRQLGEMIKQRSLDSCKPENNKDISSAIRPNTSLLLKTNDKNAKHTLKNKKNRVRLKNAP